jgi:hypothetical protein
MKYLRSATLAMVSAGGALILLSLAAGLGPIPLVAGVLLLWSGVVKLVVLRIWRHTLGTPAPPQLSADPPSEAATSRSS